MGIQSCNAEAPEALYDLKIDTALEEEGFRFKRSILTTPEHRLSMALHWLSTDIINGQMFNTIDAEQIALLEAKSVRLTMLQTVPKHGLN